MERFVSNSPHPHGLLNFRDYETTGFYDELIDEIYITVLHEVGHHFGMDEERLDELGYG